MQRVAIVAMGARFSRRPTHGVMPPCARRVRTSYKLKTQAHVVTAYALCDMPRDVAVWDMPRLAHD
jgi:hypothetical protein